MCSVKLLAWVSLVEDLPNLNFNLFDFVILGNPFCRVSWQNPFKSLDVLKNAIDKIVNVKEKVLWSLPIAPLDKEFDFIYKAVSLLSSHNVQGVVVESHAMAWFIKNNFPTLNIYFGGFANVHTYPCVKEMERLGALGGVLPYEITLDEAEYILKNSSLDIFLPVLGRFPIAFSQYCFFYPDRLDYPFSCSRPCRKGEVISYGKVKEKVLHKGRVIFSYKALNMLHFIPLLMKKGFRSFLIEGLTYDFNSVNKMGYILQSILKEGKALDEGSNLYKEFVSLFPEGFCNGFYFGKRGVDFVKGEYKP